jgi:hypothetical protein
VTAVEPTTASGSSSGTPSGGPGGSRGGGIAVRLLIALVALGAVAGLVFVLLPDSTPSATTVVPGPAASDPLAPPPPTLASVAPLTASTPLRVHVPSIFADSSLVPVGVDAQNKVQVPPVSQPMQAAWYERAPTPGAAGPALILGHVNGGGKPGIFANLHTVREGQEIDVDRADGATAVFTVFHTETVPKDAFPTQRVYGNVPDAQLRLVTCGGDLDRQALNYLSNVIVYATLTGVRRT